MPAYGYCLATIPWLIWSMPFFLIRRSKRGAAKLDRRARWGIAFQIVAFSLLWQSSFWASPPSLWRIPLSILFFAPACLLSWTATRALGRQWRIDAGLNTDHELVRSGPYRLVRHPIYTSMLGMLLGTGLIMTPLWLLALSAVLYIAGAEIRVRIEDGLLASRFGDAFQQYRNAVPAFLPGLRLGRGQ